jgi:hypothetical protein
LAPFTLRQGQQKGQKGRGKGAIDPIDSLLDSITAHSATLRKFWGKGAVTRKRWCEGLRSIPGLRDVPFATFTGLLGLPALGVAGDRNGRVCGETFLARHADPEAGTVVTGRMVGSDGDDEGGGEGKGEDGRKQGGRGKKRTRGK